MVIMTSISSMFTFAFTYRTVCHKAMHKFWANFGSRFSWREVPVESLHHQVPIKGTKMPSNACRKKTTCWETTPKLTPKCWETCYNSLKIWTNPPTPDLFNSIHLLPAFAFFKFVPPGPGKEIQVKESTDLGRNRSNQETNPTPNSTVPRQNLGKTRD